MKLEVRVWSQVPLRIQLYSFAPPWSRPKTFKARALEEKVRMTLVVSQAQDPLQNCTEVYEIYQSVRDYKESKPNLRWDSQRPLRYKAAGADPPLTPL